LIEYEYDGVVEMFVCFDFDDAFSTEDEEEEERRQIILLTLSVLCRAMIGRMHREQGERRLRNNAMVRI
jgi:hypothetical protein